MKSPESEGTEPAEGLRWRDFASIGLVSATLIVFQIVCYGYLLAMFLVQLHMASVRDW